MGLLQKLSAVLFYAALPLIIPVAYGYALGEEAWKGMAVSVAMLMLPALPWMVAGGFRSILREMKGLVKWLLKRGENAWSPGNMAEMAGMRKLDELKMGEALALTSFAWLAIPAVCAIPFALEGLTYHDAFFESMSSWTSTGLSVMDSPEEYPQSLVLFRSVAQWVGGLGIIILMLVVLKGREARTLLKAEGRETIGAGIGKSVRAYWKIYLALSILAFGLLFALGIGMFDSANLAMAGISNGGFFPFSSYPFTDGQKLALAGAMFAGATSFLFYDNLWRGRVRKALLDEEFVAYLLVIAAAVALIALVGGDGIYNSLLNSVSAIACGGFAIGNLAVMHEFSKYVLILLMICGGMYGSTTGAVKLWRILVVGKSVLVKVRGAFLPQGAVQAVKVNGVAVAGGAVLESAVFIFAYLGLFLLGAGVFIADGKGMVDAFFLVASSLGNVGLSTLQISALSVGDKWFLAALMYLGRIEIFPSLALARLVASRFVR